MPSCWCLVNCQCDYLLLQDCYTITGESLKSSQKVGDAVEILAKPLQGRSQEGAVCVGVRHASAVDAMGFGDKSPRDDSFNKTEFFGKPSRHDLAFDRFVVMSSHSAKSHST